MVNLLDYYVANIDLNSHQLKMLQLVTDIHKPDIHDFCVKALIKDGILQKLEYLNSEKYQNNLTFFDDVLGRYTFNTSHTLIPARTNDAHRVREYLYNKFYEVLEKCNSNYFYFDENNDTTVASRAVFILNTFIHHRVLTLTDAAEQIVTIDDFRNAE